MKWPNTILKLKRKLFILSSVNKYNQKVFSCTTSQSIDEELLQTCHRIEKGMIIEDPRAGWGEEKANRIVDILEEYIDCLPAKAFYYQTGMGVLTAFLEYKKQHNDYSDMIERIEQRLMSFPIATEGDGGTIECKLEAVQLSPEEIKAAEKAVVSRHSIRKFSKESVDIKDIKNAIYLANHCPSACNRQPFHVYVISSEDRKKADTSRVIDADKYLIVTGIIDAFSLDEYNDWIVSASIFAGYLSLCMHIYGIANCPMRMDLLERAPVYSALREICNIPDNEQIILEFAIGKYCENNTAPKSNRMDADILCKDCTH